MSDRNGTGCNFTRALISKIHAAIDISFLSLREFFFKVSILPAITYKSSTAPEILVVLTALQNIFFKIKWLPSFAVLVTYLQST